MTTDANDNGSLSARSSLFGSSILPHNPSGTSHGIDLTDIPPEPDDGCRRTKPQLPPQAIRCWGLARQYPALDFPARSDPGATRGQARCGLLRACGFKRYVSFKRYVKGPGGKPGAKSNEPSVGRHQKHDRRKEVKKAISRFF